MKTSTTLSRRSQLRLNAACVLHDLAGHHLKAAGFHAKGLLRAVLPVGVASLIH